MLLPFAAIIGLSSNIEPKVNFIEIDMPGNLPAHDPGVMKLKADPLTVDIPVIMLSSQDKIDVAINCMHHRAFDYVVKSETAFMRLQKIITTIFRYKKMEKELSWYMDRM